MISSVNNNLKQQKMDKETVNQQIINGLKSKGIFIGSISPDVLATIANIMYEAINYTHCCTELVCDCELDYSTISKEIDDNKCTNCRLPIIAN